MVASLAPDGVLIYETFAEGNEQFGKPSNPEFLLKQGELLALARRRQGLRVVAYEDGVWSSQKLPWCSASAPSGRIFLARAALLPPF